MAFIGVFVPLTKNGSIHDIALDCQGDTLTSISLNGCDLTFYITRNQTWPLTVTPHVRTFSNAYFTFQSSQFYRTISNIRYRIFEK